VNGRRFGDYASESTQTTGAFAQGSPVCKSCVHLPAIERAVTVALAVTEAGHSDEGFGADAGDVRVAMSVRPTPHKPCGPVRRPRNETRRSLNIHRCHPSVSSARPSRSDRLREGSACGDFAGRNGALVDVHAFWLADNVTAV